MKKFLSIALILCMVLSIVPFYTVESDAATVYTEAESNDVIGDADLIDITDGAVVKGKISNDDDYDYDFFKFTIGQGSKVEIKSKFESTSDYAYMHYRICYETDFPEIEETTGTSTIVEYNSNLGYSYSNDTCYLAEGTYYLKVEARFDGNYNLSFNTTPLEDFSEPNDVIAQATDISAGDSYRGIISSKYYSDGDSDFFRIYSSKSSNYKVTIDCSKSADDVSFCTCDEEGQEIDAIKTDYGYSTEKYIDKGEKGTFEVKMPAGNAYLRIRGQRYYYASGEYTISVSDAGGTNVGNDSNNADNDSDYDNSGNNGDTDDDDTYTEWDIKNMVKDMQLYALSKKTSKKNINVTIARNDDLELIESLGYSVEYRLYRVAKKPSKFSFRSKKMDSDTFVNTKGKRGTRYYYKMRVVVYDEYGYRIASTKLNQCTYTSRKWTK